MAIELGVSQPTVWRIEHGEQRPSKPVGMLINLLAQKIAEADQSLTLGLHDHALDQSECGGHA